MTHGRKPRKPRPVRDPFKHARRYATALTAAELAELKLPIIISLEAMRNASYREDHLCMLHAVFLISEEIEASGIVRGLAHPIKAALQACTAIRARAESAEGWKATALYADELNALREMADLHMFQIQQLSAGEIHRLAARVASRTESQGGTVQHIPLNKFTGVKFVEETE